VFCGSNVGRAPEYADFARATGRLLAGRGIGLVYGGGRVGLMGILADAALAAGGRVIGVIPRHLQQREVGHSGLTSLRVVDSMHERKALMAELSDAFIALPGGYGTLDEFAEVLTWSQLGLHAKPCGLLNVAGFYDNLLAFIDHSVAQGFVRADSRALVLEAGEPAALVDALQAWAPRPVEKWLEATQI